jgi:hypothetical protein
VSRDELRLRQELVLGALLRGEVPDGFDPRSAGLTVRVLRTKRRSDALEAVPVLADVTRLAERFDPWAAAHPRRGCAHDDVLDFVTDVDGPLPEPLASIRAVERVYRRRAHWARDRRTGARPWVVAVGPRVWHVGPRVAPTSPPGSSALVS